MTIIIIIIIIIIKQNFIHRFKKNRLFTDSRIKLKIIIIIIIIILWASRRLFCHNNNK